MSLNHNRRKQLISMLETEGEVRVRDVMRIFSISEETARRDIKTLERDGLALHVHGGAVATQQPRLVAFNARSITRKDEKDAIAKAAIELIRPGYNIFLGGGSTVLQLARLLHTVPELRIVTNMVDTAFAASESGRHRIVLLGGDFNADYHTTSGFAGIRAICEQRFDLAFIGVDAVHPELGIFDHEEGGQVLARTLREQSQNLAVLADQSKFGSTARFRILPLQDISFLVTNAELQPHIQASLSTNGLQVIWPKKNGHNPS